MPQLKRTKHSFDRDSFPTSIYSYCFVLQANGQPTDEVQIVDSLFDCGSGGTMDHTSFYANKCGGDASTAPDFYLWVPT